MNQCKLSEKYFTDVFKDCKELKINGYTNDGVYFIYPYLPIATSVRVYCDMTTDGGGLTVGFFLTYLMSFITYKHIYSVNLGNHGVNFRFRIQPKNK